MKGYDDNGNSERDDELTALARRLPREVAPQRDLWPAIEAAISQPAAPRSHPWQRIMARAAAVLVLVGGSSSITWYLTTGGGAGPATAPVMTQPLIAQPVAGYSEHGLGADFLNARADLASRLEGELMRLPPETRSDVRQNIVRIRAAIGEINLALAEEPDNALLQELLLSMYREEISVMQRVEGLASSAMRRTDI